MTLIAIVKKRKKFCYQFTCKGISLHEEIAMLERITEIVHLVLLNHRKKLSRCYLISRVNILSKNMLINRLKLMKMSQKLNHLSLQDVHFDHKLGQFNFYCL